MNNSKTPLVVSAAFLASLSPLSAHLILVDMDPATMGIQSTLTVIPGEVFEVEVALFTDTTNPLSAVALATMWNDGTAGVITQVSPTVASSGAPFFGFPAEHIADSTTVVIDDPMVNLGISPFGSGAGGLYLNSDGGAGVYGDLLSSTPGSNLKLWRIAFEATGSVGEQSDIRSFGIIDPSSSSAVALPGISASGDEFFDYGVMGSGGVGSFGAVRNIGGRVEIVAIPEPSVGSFAIVFGIFGLLRRKRA